MGNPGESTIHHKKVSVPKFDRIPWLSEASLRNKPLVLSLPKRYPHASAAFLVPPKKDTSLPNLFHVPDDLSKARRNHSAPMLVRNRQLCSTCRAMKMVQPRTLMIPNNLKLSFENCMSHRTKNLQPPKAQPVPKGSSENISTESVHCRVPILGPRTAVFYQLLSASYQALQAAQPSPASGRRQQARQ